MHRGGVGPSKREGPFFWGCRPGTALWGKGPVQLFETCLIAHLTFAGLNQGCLVWAGCTGPTGQAGGLPEAQAAEAGLLKFPSGEEKQGLSSCFSQPSWVWAPEGTGGEGRVSAGVRAQCHGGGGVWSSELFACFQPGAVHSDNTWPQCQCAALMFLFAHLGGVRARHESLPS